MIFQTCLHKSTINIMKDTFSMIIANNFDDIKKNFKNKFEQNKNPT